ncbi:MAG: hypothetical protein H8E62_01675, partial [Planctomycetes bacterium]|nr:hypothetical protein [Planctomycetota bacterium]
MKTKITLLITVMSVAFLMCGMTLWAAPLGTAFTYQGRLLDDNVAADGVYDIRFVLYDDPNTLIGNLIGQPVDANDVEVAEGYFIAELDFGGPAFGGDARWLQIAVRPYDSTDPGDYVALTPLQPITHTPYASYAKSSNWNNLANIPADFADGVDNNGGSDLDWTISGSDMYSAVSGNVGIGTSNPGASLDVTSPTGTGGAATIGSSSTTAAGAHAVAIGANADATNHYTIAMGTGATASGSYSTAIGTDIIVSGSRSVGIGVGMSSADVTASNVMAIMGGNVGIGTTIPDAKLDVIADAGTYYTVYAEHSDGNYGYLGSGGNGAAGLNSNGNSGTLGSSLYGVTGTHNLSG